MRFLIRSHMRSFHLLNASQFLGALNDNVFKLLVVYLLINVKGPEQASTILSIAGAIFVAPFLLFSSGAGILADRISKRTIIVSMKLLEVVLMSFAFIAVYFQSEFFSYFLLFMMGMQSAIFGPSKYGIIPELVEEKKVSKANGSLTSLTYLAIILGTFLASFITDISHKNFLLVSGFCVVVAITGFITSLGILKTAPRNSDRKLRSFFLYEIYRTLVLSLETPHLFPSILASAFFLFIGSYVQLNIIPYGMQSLHLSEVGGGYLFLLTAVGIAAGARIAGKLSKDKVELGLSCLAGFAIVGIFFLLSFFSHFLSVVVVLLFLLGVFGGIFLIPLESFIQIASPDQRRGQIIAASNFLSFTGVLFASICLYLFNQKLGFSAAGSFALMGLLTLIFQLTVSGRLSRFFFPYFARYILSFFYQVRLEGDLPRQGSVLIFPKGSWLQICLLFSFIDQAKILVAAKRFRKFPYVNGWVEGVKLVPPIKIEKLLQETHNQKTKESYTLLVLSKKCKEEEAANSYRKIFGSLGGRPYFIRIEKKKIPFSWSKPLRRNLVTYTFSS